MDKSSDLSHYVLMLRTRVRIPLRDELIHFQSGFEFGVIFNDISIINESESENKAQEAEEEETEGMEKTKVGRPQSLRLVLVEYIFSLSHLCWNIK